MSARVSRSVAPAIAVAGLVCVSAAVRFVVSLGVDAPWIAPDEMVYGLLGRSLWETGETQLLGGGGPFYGLYPIVAGLPLWALGTSAGLTALQALQALVMSLTAAVVFAWASRLMRPWWAFAAACMTAALPAFAYSGLIMSEALFLPVVTLALWLLGRALVRPSTQNQLLVGGAVTLAAGTRLQGLVLIPAVVLAVALAAWFGRDPRRILRFAPMCAALTVGVVAVYLSRIVIGGQGGLVGAYGPAMKPDYEIQSVLAWTAHHFGDVFLLVVGIPVIALVCQLVAHLRDRERDPDMSALLAVTLGYIPLVVTQVGAFASEHVGQLAERDLITVAPPLFVVFAAWLSRGMPRSQPTVTIVALIVALPAILLPVRDLATRGAVPDAFMAVPLLEFAQLTSRGTLVYVWIAVTALLPVLVVFIPRRAAWALAAIVLIALLGSSVLVQRVVSGRAEADRREFFGAAPTDWIDRAADGPVIFLDEGDPLWNELWQHAFWNTRLHSAAALVVDPDRPNPTGFAKVTVDASGRLVQPDGRPLDAELVVASRPLTLVGRRLRRIDQTRNEPGLALWRATSPPALSTWTTGPRPNGDIVNPMETTVFACRQGTLDIDLLTPTRGAGSANERASVTVSVDRLARKRIPIPPGRVWRLRVATPPDADGRRSCRFRVVPDGPIRSTDILFTRHATAIAPRSLGPARSTQVEVVRGAFVPGQAEPGPPRIGHCLQGAFINLAVGQARSDPAYKGATRAIYVEGSGLTCDPPPAGYRHQGFATDEMHVPGGIYEYYAP